ncbi:MULTISPECIES: hypothetical protein [unclassified Clostridium]|uniref:hypothetical protein n=1 Tax=unclassified Clostridium TaxID=2614128 RepID=UPI00207A7392|nr:MULTISPECIES: hypothetical protein [unclassified Clostridium]
MSVKLQEKHIKNKIKSKYGEMEVYNPLDKTILSELSKMISNNSERTGEDMEIINTVSIMRYMLKYLTNIENKEYWDNISDFDLEILLNRADGDFKNVVSDLIDVMLEIGRDIRKNAERQLDVLEEKINELIKMLKFNNNVDKSLDKLGLNRDLLNKVANGDVEAKNEFEKIITDNKSTKKKIKNKKN